MVVSFVGWQGALFSCGHDDDTGEAFLLASVVRFPDRHDRNRGWFRCRPPVLPVGRCIGFAVVMAQVRRPVPFRTRKLRPGRGDGTALERVWESSTPPHSFVGVPVERDAPGTLFFVCLPVSGGSPGVTLREPLFLFPRTGVSSIRWRETDAGRPGGGRIPPPTGSPGTLGDPRNSRGASCPYPMVE